MRSHPSSTSNQSRTGVTDVDAALDAAIQESGGIRENT